LLVDSLVPGIVQIPGEKYRVMELKIIKTKKQYEEFLDWVDMLFDKKVKADTPQGDKLQIALLLIKQYEDANYPIPLPDPIDAIRVKKDELGLKNKDLQKNQ